jgi:hypothetical protein
LAIETIRRRFLALIIESPHLVAYIRCLKFEVRERWTRNSPDSDDNLLRIISLLPHLTDVHITAHYGCVIWANLSFSCKQAIFEATEKTHLTSLTIRGVNAAPMSIFDSHSLSNLCLQSTSLDPSFCDYRSKPRILLRNLQVITHERSSVHAHAGPIDLGAIVGHPEIFNLSQLQSYSVTSSFEAGLPTPWDLPQNAQRVLDIAASELEKFSYCVPDFCDLYARRPRIPFDLSRLASLKHVELSGFVLTPVRRQEGLKETFRWIMLTLKSLPCPEKLEAISLAVSYAESGHLKDNGYLETQMSELDKLAKSTFPCLKALDIRFDRVVDATASDLSALRKVVVNSFRNLRAGALRYQGQ